MLSVAANVSSIVPPAYRPATSRGAAAAAEISALLYTAGVRADQFELADAEGDRASLGLPAVKPPPVQLTQELADGAEGFAHNLGAVLDQGISPRDLRDENGMASDRLLALFLMLNITDPNNAPETHNMLYEVSTELRQTAIDTAQKTMINARELMREAEKYAASMGFLGNVMGIVAVAGILVTIINPALGVVAALAQAGLQVGQAAGNAKAADLSADARGEENSAQRHRKEAEQFQYQLEEEAEIMHALIEHKNAMVDAVSQMISQRQATATKVMAAAMTR